jgi:hypothetical protein
VFYSAGEFAAAHMTGEKMSISGANCCHNTALPAVLFVALLMLLAGFEMYAWTPRLRERPRDSRM